MNSKTKETLLSNRVKIMKLCDYFIVSAPLIAKRILSLEKHKEFKNLGGNISDSKAANNARMDALLEFLDECNTPGAFDAFLEGIKNCEGQKSFAKTLKKEAEGSAAGPSKPGAAKPKLGTAMKKPKSPLGAQTPNAAGGKKKGPATPKLAPKTTPLVPGFQFFNATGATGIGKGKPPPAGSTPAKTTKKANPPEGGKRALAQKPPVKKPSVPLPPMPPPPPGLAQILASIARGGLASGPAAPSAVKPATPTPAGKPAAAQPKLAPRPSPGPTPSASTSTGAAAASAGGFVAKIPAGSPFKPKDGLKRGAAATPKSKPMTFQEVETKQKGASRATTFSFLSPAAVVKTIHFNNKSDLFYEGCPTKVGGTWCAKKVQLKGKGKKYVCKEKHENETYNLFPRLYVTFEDGTTHIQTVLYRENVEILAQMKLHDMQTANDEQLKAAFFRAHRKNIPIDVKCKKIAQKDLKKSDGATWDNIATIVLDSEQDQGGAAKRGRKSVD